MRVNTLLLQPRWLRVATALMIGSIKIINAVVSAHDAAITRVHRRAGKNRAAKI
jgi:hypothetical protein